MPESSFGQSSRGFASIAWNPSTKQTVAEGGNERKENIRRSQYVAQTGGILASSLMGGPENAVSTITAAASERCAQLTIVMC